MLYRQVEHVSITYDRKKATPPNFISLAKRMFLELLESLVFVLSVVIWQMGAQQQPHGMLWNVTCVQIRWYPGKLSPPQHLWPNSSNSSSQPQNYQALVEFSVNKNKPSQYAILIIFFWISLLDTKKSTFSYINIIVIFCIKYWR